MFRQGWQTHCLCHGAQAVVAAVQDHVQGSAPERRHALSCWGRSGGVRAHACTSAGLC